MFDNWMFLAVLTVIAIVAALAVGFVISRLYKRASKETAFVRTGFRGEHVVKDGGAVILPVLHDTIDVNMQTLRLEVTRRDEEALITKDKQRVNVKASFFVNVRPDKEAISRAAQTLGKRTMTPSELHKVVEDKFVGGLRDVAASMDLNQLHESRASFVQAVSQSVSEDLDRNGLGLESVSLTELDQTDPRFSRPETNLFDAEGATMRTRVIEERAKERNEIQQTNRIAIEQRNQETNLKSLEIKRADEFAVLEQQREVETRRAEQEADLAAQRAASKRASDVAEIEASRATEIARTERDQKVKAAAIASEQALAEARVTSQVALAAKSEEESVARARADEARAKAVTASEAVTTAEATAVAERNRAVAVLQARQEAEQDATRIRVEAEAEAEAATLRAEAQNKLLDVKKREYEVEAAGREAINLASGRQTPEQIQLQTRLALIENMPEILRAQNEFGNNIDSFRVVVTPGSGGFSGGDAAGSTGNIPADLANSLLKYRLQSPVVDAMGKELGLDLSKGLGSFDETLKGFMVSSDSVDAISDEQ